MSDPGYFSPGVLRRFITLMVIALVGLVVYVTILEPWFVASPPGDYETRHCDNRLSEGEFEKAIDWAGEALAKSPEHRGAMMCRAIAFHQLGRTVEAEAAYTALIAFLEGTLTGDDPTGLGTLAAAYANRGILHDQAGRHARALADYEQALSLDPEAVAGPDIFHRILHNPRPSSIDGRAAFLREQLALPEDQRGRLVNPDASARQKMHKP